MKFYEGFFRVFSMFSGHLTICLNICKLFRPVKEKKNFEIYQRKQYLKAQLDYYKTAKFGSLYSRGKNPKYFLQKCLGMTYLLVTSIFVF